MKKYVGIKVIEAAPMDLGTYNLHRGWDIPDNEDPKREGYLVVYADGYKSWSPKEVFESAYHEISANVHVVNNTVSIEHKIELMNISKGCARMYRDMLKALEE